jgi:hypothetical protein
MRDYIIAEFFLRYGDILGFEKNEENIRILHFLHDLPDRSRKKYVKLIDMSVQDGPTIDSMAIFQKLDRLMIEEKEAQELFARKYQFSENFVGALKELHGKSQELLMEYRKRGFISNLKYNVLRDLQTAQDYKTRWITKGSTLESSALCGKNHIFFDLGIWYLKKRKMDKQMCTENIFPIWMVYMFTDTDPHSRAYISSKDDEALSLLFQNFIRSHGGLKWALSSMKRSIVLKNL